MSKGKIKRGIFGNFQTVNHIRRMAHERKGHPLVRKLAENIVIYHQVKDHFYLDEAIAIGAYVQERVRYTKDPDNIEMLRDPVLMIKEIQENGQSHGDCDDMSLLASTLMLSIGLRPYLKIVKYNKNSSSFNHIYVIAHEKNFMGPKETVAVDCIVKHKPIGFEVPHEYSKLFPV